MYHRKSYRSLDRTLVVDSRVREVSDKHNNVIRSQTHAVGVPTDGVFQSNSIIVGPKGFALPETKGFLHIDTGNPLKMQIGATMITIEGQFLLTGNIVPVVLISEIEQRVHVIQY